MSEKLHELESRLAAARQTPDRADALLALAEHLAERDAARAVELSEAALLLAAALNDPLRKAKSHLCLAQAHYLRSEYPDSIRHALSALDLAREHTLTEQEAHALSHLGANHEAAGAWPEALGCFVAAQRLYEKIDHKRGISSQLNHIGALHWHSGNYAEAERSLSAALALDRQNGAGSLAVATRLFNHALVYEKLGRIDAAVAAVRESLDLFRAENDAAGAVRSLTALGDIRLRQGDFPAAEKMYQEALDAAQKSGARQAEGRVYTLLARLDLERRQPQAALPRLENAVAIFTQLDSPPSLADAHELLAQAYKALGRFEDALQHYETFHALREALFNTQTDARMNILQTLYQVEAARQEAQDEMQREIEQREQLIADLDIYAEYVAHNLKNPIGNVLGFGELLLLDGDDLSPERRAYLDAIMASATKMDQIVEALLRLARVRLEEMPLQPVNMQTVMNEAQQRLAPVIERYRGTLSVEGPLPPALGYGPWIEEVWVNYITNGLKYGGSSPQITVGAQVLHDGYQRYWVRDSGSGIPPAKQRQLFNKFERLGVKKVEGYGLGLAMVRQIVEKLNGRVGVISTGVEGQGATFYFDLHAAPDDTRG